MCKKILNFLVLGLLLSSSTILAQSKTVSGTITDESGVPLAGANVILKGTSVGVSSNFDGQYAINLENDGTLVFSMLGFTTQEISTSGQTVINVSLKEDISQLNEVVVTALGITKEKKALGYAVQEVDSEEISRAANGNINTALQGKVAGVNITTSGGVTGNARIDLRGPSSLTGNDRVLWVIDGVPFSDLNATDPGDLFGGTSNGGGLLDINPDDIESISVLKGGQAAALYGSRGANGVILVTTKSGKGSKGLGISYNTAITFSDAAYLLDTQDEYGQGSEGVFNAGSRVAWGPRFDGAERTAWTGENLPYQGGNNLVEDFTRTAVNLRHAISFMNSNEKGNYRASILSDKNEGVFDNNQLKKLNFDIRAAYDINDWLNIDTKVSYIRNRGQQRPEIGFYSFVSQLNGTPPNIRTQDLAPGFVILGNENVEYLFGPNLADLTANPNANARNPYFVQAQSVNNDERNRIFGYLAGTFKFTDYLDLRLKYGIDFYRYKTVQGYRFADNVDTNRPNYNTGNQFFKEDNLEFLLRFNKDLNEDFNLGISLGGNQMRNGFDLLESFSGRLTSQNDFFLNAGQNRTTRETFSEREIQSVYGFLDVSYKDYLFLTATARNDWSSALPSSNNSYFYPSVGLSAIISEITEMPEWISYLKLRGSWAQLGKDTLPYQTNPVFTFSNFNFNLLAAGTPDDLVNQNLEPEISTTHDFGIEARLFGGKLTLDATFYNERTENQILPVPIGQSSGFTSRVDNVGLISNKGIELIATVTPVRTEDFSLGLTFNFAKNKSVLEELTTAEDNDEIFFFFNSNTIPVQVRATEGEKMGDIYGFAYQRDASGGIIVDADGLPARSEEVVKLGNIQADFTGSIGIDANYKNFSISALLGMQQGGDIYSLTEASATGSGNALKTLSLGREPFFADGNLADGSPNVEIVSPQAYWGRVSGISEEFMYDASFMKLTELSISYAFPSKILDKLGKDVISGARLSLIGRNLFYLYRNTPGTVPDASVYNTTFGAQAFDFSPVPATRSLGVALNLNF